MPKNEIDWLIPYLESMLCVIASCLVKTTIKVKKLLLRPMFTFVVRWRPLVAVVIMRAAKEEVRRSSSIQSLGRRSG